MTIIPENFDNDKMIEDSFERFLRGSLLFTPQPNNWHTPSRESGSFFMLDSSEIIVYTMYMRANRPAITAERITEINEMICANPGWNRSKLSQELCKKWGWIGENGQIKDISCRDVLRALDSTGAINLPAPQSRGRIIGANEHISLMIHDTTPIEGQLSLLQPLSIEVVAEKTFLAEFKSYVVQYHYLGYDRNIGENIKYFIRDKYGRNLACLVFGSAARKCDGRDKYIGRDSQTRKQSLRYMTNNTRYLILPWVKVPHLASHILSLVCRRISVDWVAKYGHPLYILETFVECGRFQGTCYKAANWIYAGKTTGRGRNSKTKEAVLPIKDVFVYPLHRNSCELLCHI